jgi:hypothetical protein
MKEALASPLDSCSMFEPAFSLSWHLNPRRDGLACHSSVRPSSNLGKSGYVRESIHCGRM